MILRSVRVAATEMVHGATLLTEPSMGPLLPAETETTTPRRTAWNAPTAIVSAAYSCAKTEPRDAEMTSTPSAMASSNAARMSSDEQPSSHHTL
jgi:hypothetical protein